jgi:hypothetical protein
MFGIELIVKSESYQPFINCSDGMRWWIEPLICKECGQAVRIFQSASKLCRQLQREDCL